LHATSFSYTPLQRHQRLGVLQVAFHRHQVRFLVDGDGVADEEQHDPVLRPAGGQELLDRLHDDRLSGGRAALPGALSASSKICVLGTRPAGG